MVAFANTSSMSGRSCLALHPTYMSAGPVPTSELIASASSLIPAASHAALARAARSHVRREGHARPNSTASFGVRNASVGIFATKLATNARCVRIRLCHVSGSGATRIGGKPVSIPSTHCVSVTISSNSVCANLFATCGIRSTPVKAEEFPAASTRVSGCSFSSPASRSQMSLRLAARFIRGASGASSRNSKPGSTHKSCNHFRGLRTM